MTCWMQVGWKYCGGEVDLSSGYLETWFPIYFLPNAKGISFPLYNIYMYWTLCTIVYKTVSDSKHISSSFYNMYCIFNCISQSRKLGAKMVTDVCKKGITNSVDTAWSDETRPEFEKFRVVHKAKKTLSESEKHMFLALLTEETLCCTWMNRWGGNQTDLLQDFFALLCQTGERSIFPVSSVRILLTIAWLNFGTNKLDMSNIDPNVFLCVL